MSEEKLEFSRNLLIYSNLALLAWTLLAFLSVWLYNQIFGYLLLLFDAFVLYAILRRLGCSSCYLCKSCTSGFGRLAGAFFGTGQTKEGSVGNRKGLVAFVYVLLFLLPVGLLSISLVQDFTFLKATLLASLLLFSVYSLATWRKTRKT